MRYGRRTVGSGPGICQVRSPGASQRIEAGLHVATQHSHQEGPSGMLGLLGATQVVSGSQGAKAPLSVFVLALLGLVACQSHGLFTSGIIKAR